MLQIGQSAKKLWGVEEQRDDKGLLQLNDHQMWRDSTWSIAGWCRYFLWLIFLEGFIYFFISVINMVTKSEAN